MTLDRSLFSSFAQGAMPYSDHYPGGTHSRIVIVVRFERSDFIPVIVDTAAPWPVLDPKIAEEIGINYQTGDEAPELLIRGQWYSGWYCRIVIGLEAEDGYGTGIDVEATVFVPRLELDEEPRPPNFLGLDGFLSKIRFAVDPENNLFYFGPLGE